MRREERKQYMKTRYKFSLQFTDRQLNILAILALILGAGCILFIFQFIAIFVKIL